MADMIQFENFAPGESPNCAACEEMLLDATEGLLSPPDQQFFDRHLAGCVPCMERLSAAQRGAAWLHMLREERPEPSRNLLERILAETCQAEPFTTPEIGAAAGEPLRFAAPPLLPHVLPFAPRPAAVSRFTRFTRAALEPRFAMTAAMAFFSISLTLSLSGVRLDQLRASDFNPTALRRSYYQANAHAVRFYDNLRVVRVLESRVDDLRQLQSGTADAPEPPANEQAPQPGGKPQPQEKGKPDEKDRPASGGGGTSRRESPLTEENSLRSRLRFPGELLRRIPAAQTDNASANGPESAEGDLG